MKIRKVIVLLILINLTLFSSFALMLEANAVGVSKVVSQAAKKTAREAITDITITMSYSFITENKYTPKKPTPPKEGYEIICLPKDKKPDGECSAPLQVKKDIKRSEVSEVVERQLDKKIAGGVTATKWGKFLDWFVPIFAAGLGVAVVDYAIDGDVMSLFDEVAYDSLVELGFLEGLAPTAPSDGGGFVRPDITIPDELPLDAKKWEATNLYGADNIDALFDCSGVSDCIQFEAVYSSKNYEPVLRVLPKYGGTLSVNVSSGYHESVDFGFTFASRTQLQLKKYATTAYGLDTVRLEYYPLGIPMKDTEKAYISGIKHENGTHMLRPEATTVGVLNLLRFTIEPNIPEVGGVKKPPLLFTYIPSDDLPPVELPPPVGVPKVPKFDEAELQPTKKVGSNVPLVAPGAYPLEETKTGTVVYPYVDPDGNVVYKTDDGRVVIGDDVTVKEPTITENPDGTLKVEKAPTPENPNPPPGQLPGTDNPGSDLKCERDFKDIEFDKVGEAFTNAFPFSIPWDLKRFIDNAFGGIGSERPSFPLTFLGDGIVLEIPEFFDSWVVFLKGLIVILFDISLIFLFYRFMKGGGD